MNSTPRDPVQTSQPIVQRLRREGADAFNQKYSLGMFKLCSEAADRIEELESLGRFLVDRLEEFDPGDFDAERDFHGHVVPALARFSATLPKQEPGT